MKKSQTQNTSESTRAGVPFINKRDSGGFFSSEDASPFISADPIQKQEEQEKEEQEELQLQKKPHGSVQLQDEEKERDQMVIQQKHSSTPASSLPSNIQSKAEGVLHTDLSNVRVRESSRATRIGALAYTQGDEVTFAPGMYQPKTMKGQELIGHELTHVKQQREGRVKPTAQAKGLSVNNDQSLEKEADIYGKRISEARLFAADSNMQANSQTTASQAQAAPPAQTKRVIQKYSDRDSDGGDYVELEIEDGTYVLEAANIPCAVSWDLTYSDYADVYGTASQYDPRHINGLDSSPQNTTRYGTKIRDTEDGTRQQMHIEPGADLEPAAGEGSAAVDAYRHDWGPDEERLRAYVRFDTVPLVRLDGTPELVTGKAYDLDPSKHEYFAIAEGGTVDQTETRSETLTNGFNYTEGQTITNTISSSVSSKIGTDLKVVSAEVGSQITASESIAESIQQGISVSWSETTTVSYSAGASSEAGHYVILPTAKVWRTPAFINIPDENGKKVRTVSGYVYTFYYNAPSTVLRTNASGTEIYDPEGNKIN